jgi:hypothetical protein
MALRLVPGGSIGEPFSGANIMQVHTTSGAIVEAANVTDRFPEAIAAGVQVFILPGAPDRFILGEQGQLFWDGGCPEDEVSAGIAFAAGCR